MNTRTAARHWLAATVLTLSGCVGTLDEPGATPGSGGTRPTSRSDAGTVVLSDGMVVPAPTLPDGATAPPVATCDEPILPARAVLATEQQYRNTLSDLLGEAAVAEVDETNDLLFEVIDRPRMGTGRLDRVLRMAETAVEATRDRLGAILDCDSLGDRVCVREGLSALAHRAYKRPVTDSEIGELMALYDQSLRDAPPTMPAALDAPPPSNAVFCSNEYQMCNLPSGVTATVWYGRETGWTGLTGVSGAVECSNAVFGDPFFGDAKACYYVPGDATVGGNLVAEQDAVLLPLTAMLVSPSTLYRTEFRDGATSGLNAHERAAAIAALLLDSIPDEALLAAADNGSLATPEGLDAQLSRLLQLPRVRTHLTDIFLHAFNIPKLFESPKDTMVFPSYTAGLQASMYEESRRLIEDVLWTRSAPVTELLTTRQSFINPPLAAVYGIDYPGTGDAFVPVTLPESRAGMLTQPSLMSVLSRTDHTSVVARGLFVRGAILCAPKLPGPPAALQSAIEEQLSAGASEAELAAYRASNATCAGCHSQFDRFGLVLERFDPIGAELPGMEEPVDLTGLLDFQGEVSGATDLISRIADTPQFMDCMTERMLSYALSEAQTTGSLCLPTDLADTLHGGDADIATLLSAVIRHPNFVLRGEN